MPRICGQKTLYLTVWFLGKSYDTHVASQAIKKALTFLLNEGQGRQVEPYTSDLILGKMRFNGGEAGFSQVSGRCASNCSRY